MEKAKNGNFLRTTCSGILPLFPLAWKKRKKKQSASLDMGRKERKVENNGENSSKFVAGIGNQQAARDFRIKAPTALLQMEL